MSNKLICIVIVIVIVKANKSKFTLPCVITLPRVITIPRLPLHVTNYNFTKLASFKRTQLNNISILL